jgi:hypothetical protein
MNTAVTVAGTNSPLAVAHCKYLCNFGVSLPDHMLPHNSKDHLTLPHALLYIDSQIHISERITSLNSQSILCQWTEIMQQHSVPMSFQTAIYNTTQHNTQHSLALQLLHNVPSIWPLPIIFLSTTAEQRYDRLVLFAQRNVWYWRSGACK